MKKLLNAWHWVQALRQSSKGDLASALSHVSAIEKSSILRPHEIAFKGTILLRQRKMSEAKDTFLRAVDLIGEPECGDAHYTMLFSTALLHGMHGQLDKEKDALVRARSISCSKSLKRWLPLYDVDEFGVVKTPGKAE